MTHIHDFVWTSRSNIDVLRPSIYPSKRLFYTVRLNSSRVNRMMMRVTCKSPRVTVRRVDSARGSDLIIRAALDIKTNFLIIQTEVPWVRE